MISQIISDNIDCVYDYFQALTFKSLVANVIFAGVKRQVRWLPTFLMGPIFAFVSSSSIFIAEALTVRHIPKEFQRESGDYYKDHPSFHLLYYIYFFSCSIIGSAVLTQGLLLLLSRGREFKVILQLAAFDLIPFYYHEFFGSLNEYHS